ncbi:MAG: hypothetical protein Q6370_010675 [Candidatus Sigynarchaeota archaeon]
MKVHLVVAPNVTVLAAYTDRAHAEVHANTIMGGQVLSIDVRSDYPDSVVDDLVSDLFDDCETPVEVPIPVLRGFSETDDD